MPPTRSASSGSHPSQPWIIPWKVVALMLFIVGSVQQILYQLKHNPLKSLIILEILSFHRDLSKITTLVLFLHVVFFFFLCRVFRFTSLISQSFKQSHSQSRHLFFPGQGDTPGSTTELWLSPARSHEPQGAARPQVTRVHTGAVTRTRHGPVGNASQASPVSTGTKEITELGRFLKYFQV